jgi:4Fe-4S single cluster domain
MPNKFCRYLSNGYTFFAHGQQQVMLKPCCWFKGPAIALDQEHLEHRSRLYETINTWTDACRECQVLENTNQPSLRQAGPDWIADDQHSMDAVSVDINLENDCNAACVTCTEKLSSLWAKENKKYQNDSTKIVLQSANSDSLIDQIIANVSLDKIKFVKFFGGEPLFTDTHLKFLQGIPNPELVTVHYTTNASIYPSDQVFETWKKFKLIIFSASLDGIEDQFEYVRWPLSWQKVSRNLINLKTDARAFNVMFRVEFTANLLNTYYYDRLEHWVNQHWSTNSAGDRTQINIHHCFGDIWSLDYMPKSVRDQILQKYQPNSSVHRLVANLPDPKPAKAWKQFVETWEPRRKNSWRQAFPDLIWAQS